MDKRFKNIKVLIWDFDGTVYKRIPELFNEIRESEYKVISSYTGWPREKIIVEFKKLYDVNHSGTTTAALLCGITTAQAAVEGERYINRFKYIGRDELLIEMFDKLKHFSHYMLVNGVKAKTEIFLKHLGLDPTLFTEIVTSETVGVNKPELAGFQYILGKTGLPPEKHLMIGDREEVDLAPAKKLGMMTCLVWKTDGKVAGISLPTVYDVVKLIV